MKIFITEHYKQLSQIAAVNRMLKGNISKQVPARLFRNHTGHRFYPAKTAA